MVSTEDIKVSQRLTRSSTFNVCAASVVLGSLFSLMVMEDRIKQLLMPVQEAWLECGVQAHCRIVLPGFVTRFRNPEFVPCRTSRQLKALGLQSSGCWSCLARLIWCIWNKATHTEQVVWTNHMSNEVLSWLMPVTILTGQFTVYMLWQAPEPSPLVILLASLVVFLATWKSLVARWIQMTNGICVAVDQEGFFAKCHDKPDANQGWALWSLCQNLWYPQLNG